MVLINKINWISKNAQEAEVYLYDGTFELKCFSQPFSLKEGDIINDKLYTYNTQKIYYSENKDFYVKKNGSLFEYELCGKIIDKSLNLIKIGEFIIELDIAFPDDLFEKDYVVIFCERIDIY
ncbi:hypothetical protein OBK20_08020 [Empedobacter falsenii]|uniref:hypothetical protein n=1 Tax=unclassified Empedobacter TaxID=2643773 RepID=UPI0025781704|nr:MULTISPECIES: hypothetical protein [unclassified Empedobacter]MDM1523414.1 hypothetical protein [Empedobacter sp. 225-1]MDM1543470.1 hypothetical protein [Empedobacter sp. 189-2]